MFHASSNRAQTKFVIGCCGSIAQCRKFAGSLQQKPDPNSGVSVDDDNLCFWLCSAEHHCGERALTPVKRQQCRLWQIFSGVQRSCLKDALSACDTIQGAALNLHSLKSNDASTIIFRAGQIPTHFLQARRRKLYTRSNHALCCLPQASGL